MGGLKSDMSGLKSDVRGLGSILTRIELGFAEAQKRLDSEKDAARINPVALASVLITIIVTLVGGAWTISGQLGRLDERSVEFRTHIQSADQRAWQGVRDGAAAQH